MNNLKIEISPEEFNDLSTTDKKLNVIYTALVGQQKNCETINIDNEVRFKKLERRKIKDSGLAALFGAAAGLLGGFFKGGP